MACDETTPDCISRGREIDMSDVRADPVVTFQTKYSMELRMLLCFIIPTLVPMTFWKETRLYSILTQCVLRLCDGDEHCPVSQQFWDYKASELPYFNDTFQTDAMAKIGWAYDMREPSRELVDKVVYQIGYESAIKASLNYRIWRVFGAL